MFGVVEAALSEGVAGTDLEPQVGPGEGGEGVLVGHVVTDEQGGIGSHLTS